MQLLREGNQPEIVAKVCGVSLEEIEQWRTEDRKPEELPVEIEIEEHVEEEGDNRGNSIQTVVEAPEGHFGYWADFPVDRRKELVRLVVSGRKTKSGISQTYNLPLKVLEMWIAQYSQKYIPIIKASETPVKAPTVQVNQETILTTSEAPISSHRLSQALKKAIVYGVEKFGVKIEEITEVFDVTSDTVNKWLRKYQTEDLADTTKQVRPEYHRILLMSKNRQLTVDVQELREKNILLNAVLDILSSDLGVNIREKYQEIFSNLSASIIQKHA